MVNRDFGSIRPLPSGRWQVRYRPRDGAHIVRTVGSHDAATELLRTIKYLVEVHGVPTEQVAPLFRVRGGSA